MAEGLHSQLFNPQPPMRDLVAGNRFAGEGGSMSASAERFAALLVAFGITLLSYSAQCADSVRVGNCWGSRDYVPSTAN